MIDIQSRFFDRRARRVTVCRILQLLFMFETSAAFGDTTLLINANIVDVEAERVIENTTVLIDGGIIKEIGPRSQAPESNINVIDIEGMFLLPGYIDSHVHIDSLAGTRRALNSGVTTARSASTSYFQDVALNALFHAGGIMGPEIIPAGTLIQKNLGETILGDSRAWRISTMA